ncbi:MAG: 6-bladed beta-propeller [Prevotellaceae bacterium]|jgi:hypothetical protein|nr:6-bladed beta-propeller [Prevotellaceae bacterium]
MKRMIYLFCIVSLCISCEQKQDVRKIEAVYTVNLDDIKPEGDPLMASAIFKNVKTIILEDHDYAVIGMINELQVFEDKIFILDYDFAKKLFVFDKNGKFVRQIGSKGQGPGEYRSIDDFCIDVEKRAIYILDRDGSKVFVYNLDTGKYLNAVKLSPDESSCNYLAYYDNKLYTATVPYDYRKKSNLLMELDIKTGEQKEYLDADTYNCGWNRLDFGPNNFFSAKLSDSPKFLAQYMNTVMNIDKDGVYPYLTVNHKNWVQSSDMLSREELEEQETDQQGILISKKRTWLMQHNYLETDKYICFKYIDEYRPYLAMFDKHTRETGIYNYLHNDLRGQVGFDSSLKFYNSHAAYEYIDPQLMPIFVAAIKNNADKLPLNLDKRDELLKLNEESIVIFEYEFK